MGKAQSKRSVDITTDPKKDVIEEGTGELKKIDVDIDQIKPQENGDTTQHKVDEKSAEQQQPAITTTGGEAENEKDSTTEKDQQKSPQISAEGAGGDDAVVAGTTAAAAAAATENGNETLDESKGDAPITDASTTAETPDSNKKPKKEKLKKKWSFRALSFGKKDKQKPVKKDEAVAAAAPAATNGECEKVPEEATEESAIEKSETTTTATIPESNANEQTTTNTTTVEKVETIDAAVADPINAADNTKDKPIEKSSPAVEVVPITNGISKTETENVEEVAAAAVVAMDSKVDEISDGVAAIEMNGTTNKPDEIDITPSSVTTNGATGKHSDDVETTATTNGDDSIVQKIENATLKQNGSIESPKIEVKEDVIATCITTTTTTIITSDNQQKVNNEIDGESCKINEKIIIDDAQISKENPPLESLQSYPPPPLPCSPPPSQVMVFALNDSHNQQIELNDNQEMEMEKNDASSINILNKEIIIIDPTTDDLSQDDKLVLEVEDETSESSELDSNIMSNIEAMDVSENILTDEHVSQGFLEIEKNLNGVSQISQHEECIVYRVDEASPRIEKDIDELKYDESSSSLVCDFNENLEVEEEPITVNNSTQINASDEVGNEYELVEISETSTDVFNNIVEDSSKFLGIISEQHPVTDEIINLNWTNEQNELPTSSSVPQKTFSDLIVNNTISIDTQEITKNFNDDEIIEECQTEKLIDLQEKIDSILSEGTVEPEKLLMNDEDNDNNIADTETNKPIKTQSQNQQQQQHHHQYQNKKNKENGVNEKNNGEVTVTESLNGVEHTKTIEELKAENNSSTEITQEAITAE